MYYDVLILHAFGVLRHTSLNDIAQVLCGGLRVDIAKVNHPATQQLAPVQATKAIHAPC